MTDSVSFQRDIPLAGSFDVLVCGGGSAGATAAVAAARQGAKTLVLESGFALGGMSTSGLLGRLGPYHDQEKFILGGLPWKILQELVASCMKLGLKVRVGGDAGKALKK